MHVGHPKLKLCAGNGSVLSDGGLLDGGLLDGGLLDGGLGFFL
jgi:hypothetical protein